MNSIRHFIGFLLDIFKSRRMLFEMTRNDFQRRYLGSYLGILWAFIQPTATILIFWFVFEVGFKAQPVDKFPFILWLISGMIPWFFISDSISGATGAIVESVFLVKKVVFRVSILPIIKILSALVVHVFFLVFMMGIFAVYGYYPSLYSLQIFYYLFAMIVLVVGIAWLTSALVVFLPDVGQAVGMFLQFGFWLTPIFWSLRTVPEKYHGLLLLNPVYYIVEGYRNSLIYGRWFWEDGGLFLYFWSVALLVFAGGALVFRRLRPHFADVL